MTYKNCRGFTLVEVSIVLVIIGLIIGSVLVGQDLIGAAEVRSTISQVERYDTAANTFVAKYGYLPGDIPNRAAIKYGFAPRGNCGGTGAGWGGEGNGNGIIEGSNGGCSWTQALGQSYFQIAGEAPMFWEDLTYANGKNINMIEGNFSTAMTGAMPNGINPSGAQMPQSQIDLFLPRAKLGRGNYIYVWNGGTSDWMGGQGANNGLNLFGISAVYTLCSQYGCDMATNPNIPVSQAYAIDKKMDDGLPMTGRVTTSYVSEGYVWSQGRFPTNSAQYGTFPAAPGYCVDNGGNPNNAPQYSIEVDGGTDQACGISIEFQ